MAKRLFKNSCEAGKRFVTDIELTYLAKVLRVSYAELLDEKK